MQSLGDPKSQIKQKQACNAGSLDRGKIKIIKQLKQQLFAKYGGDIMKTNISLPEIDFVNICGRMEFLINFARKKLVKISIFILKSRTWDP